MQTSIAAFVRFYKGSTTYARWQNFFFNRTVSNYSHRNFDVGSIVINREATDNSVDIMMPTTGSNVSFVEKAIDDLYLVQVTLYELPSSSVPTSLSGATVVGQFVGEVIDAALDAREIVVEIGSAIDAVTGDIPGRKITTSLVGRLPKL